MLRVTREMEPFAQGWAGCRAACPRPRIDGEHGAHLNCIWTSATSLFDGMKRQTALIALVDTARINCDGDVTGSGLSGRMRTSRGFGPRRLDSDRTFSYDAGAHSRGAWPKTAPTAHSWESSPLRRAFCGPGWDGQAFQKLFLGRKWVGVPACFRGSNSWAGPPVLSCENATWAG